MKDKSCQRLLLVSIFLSPYYVNLLYICALQTIVLLHNFDSLIQLFWIMKTVHSGTRAFYHSQNYHSVSPDKARQSTCQAQDRIHHDLPKPRLQKIKQGLYLLLVVIKCKSALIVVLHSSYFLRPSSVKGRRRSLDQYQQVTLLNETLDTQRAQQGTMCGVNNIYLFSFLLGNKPATIQLYNMQDKLECGQE